MQVIINAQMWLVVREKGNSPNLMRSDGTYTLGMTDNRTHTIYIHDRAEGQMFEKILCHEIVHAYCFSNHIYMDLATEEIVADFVATHGRNVLAIADGLILRHKKRAIV